MLLRAYALIGASVLCADITYYELLLYGARRRTTSTHITNMC